MQIITLRSVVELDDFTDELDDGRDEPIPVQFIIGVKDTPANLATLARTVNHRRVQILGVCPGIYDDSWAVAFGWARERGIHEARDPGWCPKWYQLFGLSVSRDVSTWFSAVDVEFLLNNGVTPVHPIQRDPYGPISVVIPRSITSYHRDENGCRDYRWLDTCCVAPARTRGNPCP